MPNGRQHSTMGPGVKFTQIRYDVAGLLGIVGEQFPLRRADPAQLQSVTADTGEIKQKGQGRNSFLSIKITILVMTFTRMSPGHEDTVVAFDKGVHDKQRIDPAGTHYPHRSNGGGILETGYTGQVGAGISTPVAQKPQYFRLKRFVHAIPFA